MLHFVKKVFQHLRRIRPISSSDRMSDTSDRFDELRTINQTIKIDKITTVLAIQKN